MTSHPDHAPDYRAIRFTMGWITRPLFGIFMAVVAIGALILGPGFFSGLVILMALFGAREWHRMVRSQDQAVLADLRAFHVQTVITVATIAASILVLLEHLPVVVAFVLLGVGTVGAFIEALRRHDNPVWHAIGLLYLGLPALALVGLRALLPQGVQTIIGLFLIVWATDTGALVFGKLIGGPRIAPRLSPGKTWSGTIGGSLCAALVFGIYIGFFGFDMLKAMVFAFVFSFTAHGGDLLESAIKRHFGKKDSGSMIPGHGGVLDRMDSTFASSLVLAVLVFYFHLNPLFSSAFLGSQP